MLALCALLLLPAAPARGQGSAWTGTADARLEQVTLTAVPPVFLDPLLDPAGAVAQAQADSLGASEAFASAPFPGEAVITLDGTLAAVTGGQVTSEELPAYPLVARSSHPLQPEDAAGAGPLSLTAASTATSSSARATDGVSATTAAVTHDPDSGEVVATARTSQGDLELPGLLTIGAVTSRAEARQLPSGEVELSSEFTVTGAMLMGTPVLIGTDGITVADAGQPLPLDLGTTLAPLLEALGEGGVELVPLPEERTENGITSAGLQVVVTSEPPPELASGVEQVVTTVTLGRTAASVDNRAIPAFSPPSGPGEVATPAVGAGSGTGGSAGGAVVGASGSSGPGSSGSAGGGATGGAARPVAAVSSPAGSPTTPAAPASAPAGPTVAAVAEPLLRLVSADSARVAMARFYPALLLVAGVVGLGGRASRRLARTWMDGVR